MKQPGDGLVDGRAVGDGHGLAPFPVETRQGALGDGAGDDDGDDVGHGAIVPAVPTRHEGDGLGCAIAAPLSPPCAPVGSVELPPPPPPPHAAVSVTIPRMRPSRRMA